MYSKRGEVAVAVLMRICSRTILLKASTKVWLSMATRSLIADEAPPSSLSSSREAYEDPDEEVMESSMRHMDPRIHALLLLLLLPPICRTTIMSTSLEASVNVKVASTLDTRELTTRPGDEAAIMLKLCVVGKQLSQIVRGKQIRKSHIYAGRSSCCSSQRYRHFAKPARTIAKS